MTSAISIFVDANYIVVYYKNSIEVFIELNLDLCYELIHLTLHFLS